MTEQQAAQEQWRWEDREHGDTYCRGDGFEVYGGEAMAAYLNQQSTALDIATAKAEWAEKVAERWRQLHTNCDPRDCTAASLVAEYDALTAMSPSAGRKDTEG